jgi:hypothetical protein
VDVNEERRRVADIRDVAKLAAAQAEQLAAAETAEEKISAALGLIGNASVIRDDVAQLAAEWIESGGEG